jgi:uncharacterized protein (TIGR00251 family)
MKQGEGSGRDPVFRVKLTPRSSMNKIVGFEGDVLKVKVTSAPVDGVANRDLIKLFSKHLKVAQERIEIISGFRSRLKEVKFHGMTENELLPLLNR